jgi:carbon starvation protein CstA
MMVWIMFLPINMFYLDIILQRLLVQVLWLDQFLAAQMGYLPGTIWLLVGVVIAGAVQDFLVLFISTRRDGRSLGEMAKQELGTFAGVVVMLGTLGVMVIILAVLALVVVKALAHSPWGVFSIAATIPLHYLWAYTCVIYAQVKLLKFLSLVLS